MCAIWAYIKLLKYKNVDNSKLFQDFWNLKPRGPDNSYLENYGDVWIGFHRLAIVEKSFKGMQPFLDKNLIFICNGEIYNYLDLNCKYKIENCNNDCQCILELYKKLTFNDFIDVITKEIIG